VEHVKAEHVKIVSNGPFCTVGEYETDDKNINVALVTLTGRYPSNGWAVNEKCTLMAFVLSGKGRLILEGQVIELSEKDVAVISSGERYAWEGEMTILMPATPAWYLEQYKVIGE
jgi:quercetin dioxygenase-like cupin family protein